MTQFSESYVHIERKSPFSTCLEYQPGEPQKSDMKCRAKPKQILQPTSPVPAALDSEHQRRNLNLSETNSKFDQIQQGQNCTEHLETNPSLSFYMPCHPRITLWYFHTYANYMHFIRHFRRDCVLTVPWQFNLLDLDSQIQHKGDTETV